MSLATKRATEYAEGNHNGFRLHARPGDSVRPASCMGRHTREPAVGVSGAAAVKNTLRAHRRSPLGADEHLDNCRCGLITVISQRGLLGVVTLWIATRQSRVGRVIGGSILAVLSMALTYGMIFGPMWKE